MKEIAKKNIVINSFIKSDRSLFNNFIKSNSSDYFVVNDPELLFICYLK